MKIEGIPEGYELVRLGQLCHKDVYLSPYGEICVWETDKPSSNLYPIVRKIERPKQYRPFASAEEFKPHRHKWWRMKKLVTGDSHPSFRPSCSYSDWGFGGNLWKDCFERYVFEDGTPFGVEVSE